MIGGLIGLLVLLAPLWAAAQPAPPRFNPLQAPGAPRPACITVQNNANGAFPVELRVPDQRPNTFQADVGLPHQFCLPVNIAATQKIEVKVKSWMTPVGVCQLAPGGRLHIVRHTPKGAEPYNEVRCF